MHRSIITALEEASHWLYIIIIWDSVFPNQSLLESRVYGVLNLLSATNLAHTVLNKYCHPRCFASFVVGLTGNNTFKHNSVLQKNWFFSASQPPLKHTQKIPLTPHRPQLGHLSTSRPITGKAHGVAILILLSQHVST